MVPSVSLRVPRRESADSIEIRQGSEMTDEMRPGNPQDEPAMRLEAADYAPGAADAPAVPTPARRMLSRRLLGGAALLTAIVAIVLEIVAIGVASDGAWTVATVLAWAVILLTVVALVGGIVAIVLRRGRGPGIVAVVLAVLANPLVLVWLFRVVGSS
jgi:hypothetical protein